MDQDTCGRPEVEALAGRLYSEHRGRLLAIARQNSDQEDDAEEALSEAFVLFLTKFDPRRFPEPMAWLTTTLKRVCWGTARKGRRERPEDDEAMERRAASASDPHELAEAHESAREVGAAMAELKPQERRVVGLLALGCSYREIMDLTGWTYTKVNRCSAEGRARLRELGLEIYKCHRGG
jgi:RNA polymerase sigma factor (sigma-70 family)